MKIEFEIKHSTGSIFTIGGVTPLAGHDGLIQKKGEASCNKALLNRVNCSMIMDC